MIYQDINFKICLNLFGWKENTYCTNSSLCSVVVIVIVTNTINIFITAHFGSSPAPWETFWNVGVQVLRKSFNLHAQAERDDMLIALIV